MELYQREAATGTMPIPDLNEPTFAFIPARMHSQRFPGKPLAELAGMPMVVHCARHAEAAGLDTWVCSDSAEIIQVCEHWNLKAIQTGSFPTGTDRSTWAAEQLGATRIVILQGDEPLIGAESLAIFAAVLKELDESDTILNGLSQIKAAAAHESDNVKAVQLRNGRISYLSRMPVVAEPPLSGSGSEPTPGTGYLKQLGLYGGHLTTFKRFQSLGSCPLEQAERIEMMRWLAADLPLQGLILDTAAISVDTPADLEAARQALME
jgi:3-deoxy-manno-octulosonate cytidylyltransferase (CMP-KDO synthetase)